MHKVIWIVLLFAVIVGLNACDLKKTDEKQTVSVDVLPYPNKILKRRGSITLTNKNWIIANVSDSISSELATYLVKSLKTITGKEAYITDLYSTRKHAQSIKIELINNTKLSTDQSYTLDITSSHIKIKAGSADGIYYAMQTLLQLLKSGAMNNNYVLPKIIIKDSPEFLVRGILIKQSQINHLSGANLFLHLGALKINAVFIIADEEEEPILKKVAAANYISLYTGSELTNDITLISYAAQTTEQEEVYKRWAIGSEAKGIVLDLTSTANENLVSKLFVLAELAWSEKGKHNYSRFSGLSKKILANK